ncbi:hypothetical protein KK062_20080 [Fulvivirgaceae bacterium PWU5]|uniref:Uncharacterized protein n=1 Tax=Dawidia cretensis TaxID=2782350 RepID=A0AAP2E2W6_9BACT|nr:hypothetical protein [Dawidia cretensis]MBT1710554.1 hypothetical protein [Dawidia cretensis]
MNKYLVSLLLFVLTLAVTCCDDILETDLSDDTVTLRLPADGVTQTDSVAVLFWWEELEGASTYELQVVSPDNTNPQSLLIDTLVTKPQFSMTLPAGQYQWCVRGVNSGYKTEFVCRTITITETDPIPPKEIVVLQYPANNVTLKGTQKINFTWSPLVDASEYNLLIVFPNRQSQQLLKLDSALTGTKVLWELTPGEYEWCVKATHEGGETDYVCRTLTIE